MNVEELEKLIADKKDQRETLRKEALTLLEEDKVEESQAKYDEIKAIDEEIKELEDDLKDKQAEENNDEEEVEPVEVDSNENKGEKRNMNNETIDTSRIEVENRSDVTSQEVRAFKNYLETRDIDGGSLTTESGFVVIPEEVITDILTLKEKEFNLDQFVTVKSVENGSGKYPVVRQSQVAALPEVAELAENPELAVKPFFQLAYDIKTHRGYFLISREAIEDAKVNVLAELKQWMARTIAATRNAAIIDVLQNGGPGEDGPSTTLTTETVSSVDDIKNAINLNVLPNYEHNVAIVSKTAWAELDNLKDNNGNYLVQPDIKEASTKRLLGARVVVLPDEMLGEDGASTVIVGNLKDAIVLFDRSRYQASWTDYMHFGEALMVAVRQDVRLLDHKAAIVLNLNLGGTAEPEA